LTPIILLHGGAGVNPGRDYAEVRAHLGALAAESAGRLAEGAAALDAVQWAVADMEASGLYVAGRGSGPNRAGDVEMDASIMDGARHRGGAVCAVRHVASPIAAARCVMERTPHVLIAGDGADAFAREQGLARIPDDPAWFRLPVGVLPADLEVEPDALAHGTVGAVALDAAGRLAAATSTGGLFGKRPGRVGDTALLGHGTWADERVALSCTGVGEAFILAGGAADVAARVRYGDQPLSDACEAMLARVKALGGDGGVIALGRDGTHHFAWNSPGMKRALGRPGEAAMVAID
jgi:L-asparaginase/beta-aspartyl-peptidase (threonine type)